mgnify:CR=1 FL=1
MRLLQKKTFAFSVHFSSLWYNLPMTDLQKSILQKSSGENRLDPDQQRLYMGTFRERILLTLSFTEATSKDLQEHFPAICQYLKDKYPPLFLKISPNLSDSIQISLMKEAQAAGITTTIMDEKIANSPYALLFHTNHAVNLENISLDQVFPDLLKKTPPEIKEKKGFWQKLFGG